MSGSVDDTLARSAAATTRKADWKPLFDDIYDYILPYRRTDSDTGKTRVSHLFDSTAVSAAFRFAGRFQAEVTPPNTRWFEVVPGPLYPDDQADMLKRHLEHDHKILFAALDSGEFHTSSMEMYLDLCAGTGVLFVLEADTDEELVNYVCAPFSEVGIECDGKGHVCGVFWEKAYTATEIWKGWPKLQSKMGEKLKKAHEANANSKDWTLVQALTYYPNNNRSKRWRYELILKQEKIQLQEDWSKTCPAIVPRYFRLPGEDIGRGPAMIALPNVRTANKTVELILQAAALSLFGMFTATDDGILNPDKFKVEPGAIVYVESNGTGAYGGRSLERLDMASNVNLSDIVLTDQRAQVKATMMDDQLPPEAGAVRSPTEIVARQRNTNMDIGMAYGRIVSEYLVKLVSRVWEVLDKSNLLTKDIYIDQKMVAVKALGPISRAQNMADIETMVQSLELSLSLGGMELTALVFKVEEIILKIAELNGLPPSLVREKIEREQLMEMIAQIVSQQQQVANETGQPGPADALMGAA